MIVAVPPGCLCFQHVGSEDVLKPAWMVLNLFLIRLLTELLSVWSFQLTLVSIREIALVSRSLSRSIAGRRIVLVLVGFIPRMLPPTHLKVFFVSMGEISLPNSIFGVVALDMAAGILEGLIGGFILVLLFRMEL